MKMRADERFELHNSILGSHVKKVCVLLSALEPPNEKQPHYLVRQVEPMIANTTETT